MTPAQRRFSLVEYGETVPLTRMISDATGMSRLEIRDLLAQAGDRIGEQLRLKAPPLQITGDTVRAVDFAGLFVLGGNIELEVAPKFLGNHPSWREDFFLISMLTKHGKILEEERVTASTGRENDLATLIGRALVNLYWAHHRRPLRAYRSERLVDFALEGDFDPLELSLPEDEGFPQSVTSFSRRNEFNAVIRGATVKLAPLVGDGEVRAQLERIAHILPHQNLPTRLESRRLPSRSRVWQSTYDLALDVLQGLGASFASGTLLAPGYVVNTWRAWETLLTVSLRRSGMKDFHVQRGRILGTRRFRSRATEPVVVTPDLMLRPPSYPRPILVDAKYQGRIDRSSQRVDAADLYEALAFAHAAGCSEVVLAYPATPRKQPTVAPGIVNIFERIVVEDVRVIAVEVAVAGISDRGGFQGFVQNLATGIEVAAKTEAFDTTRASAPA